MKCLACCRELTTVGCPCTQTFEVPANSVETKSRIDWERVWYVVDNTLLPTNWSHPKFRNTIQELVEKSLKGEL